MSYKHILCLQDHNTTVMLILPPKRYKHLDKQCSIHSTANGLLFLLFITYEPLLLPRCAINLGVHILCCKPNRRIRLYEDVYTAVRFKRWLNHGFISFCKELHSKQEYPLQ